MSRAHLEKLEREIQKKLKQRCLKEVGWFGGWKKMLSFVNERTKRDVLTISNAHAPQIVTVTNRLGKEKQKPNIVRDYNEFNIWNWPLWPDVVLALKVKKNFELVQKRRKTHSWNLL